MNIRVALAGNPNSGKSTLFNNLTGASQYVGNWPGVTVEKKEGHYKKDKNIVITDLPGIYSLSPYTLEEVISRDFLLNEKPDVIIDVIDASNLERNLYLTTQLSELGIPLVIALNMSDVVEKRGDVIDVRKLGHELGCAVVEISALKNHNIANLISQIRQVAEKAEAKPFKCFPAEIEEILKSMAMAVPSIKGTPFERWYAVKLFENDKDAVAALELSEAEKNEVQRVTRQGEEAFEDNGEGIITNARYEFVSTLSRKILRKKMSGLTRSDRIDRVVTNRLVALPLFALIMFGVYYVAVSVVGGGVTDFVNDVVIGDWAQGGMSKLLEGWGTAPWLESLIVNGVIGGVGAPLGFLPQIIVLFFFLSILEDVGYMARIAFILDRIFRRFGLSGKSFIPILIGTGCAVPGIMGTRTIENDTDRRMTVTVAAFLPCSAKTEILALFAGSIFMGTWWFGGAAYFAGILAVIVSGVMLKKFKFFAGDPAPFVMELPEYHFPSPSNVLRATWNRTKAFIVKAGTIIFMVVIVLWFLENISVNFQFHDWDHDATASILSAIGRFLTPLFIPIGFGAANLDLAWIPTVASVAGIAAKEVVVGTMGVLQNVDPSSGAGALNLAQALFTPLSAMAFVMFNQLTIPCQACIGAIKAEMGTKRWTAFALGYQVVFSYVVALMIYQIGVLFTGAPFGVGTAVSFVILAILLYFIFRPNHNKKRLEALRVSA